MKKKFIALGVAALLISGTLVSGAFAANDSKPAQSGTTQSSTSQNSWFNQMFAQHNAWVDQAVKNGQMTQQQAQAWKNHFNYMKDFHSKNGFGMMGGNGMMDGSGSSGGPSLESLAIMHLPFMYFILSSPI